MREPLRVGLIGSSGFARAFAGPAIRESVAEFAGALGSSPAGGVALADSLGEGRGYASLDELLSDGSVDAVWIATPDALHVPFAARAIKAGKHVLVEKPMATTTEDARALVTAAEQSGVVLRVGCHQRFRPAFRDLARLVLDGSIGKLGFARLHFYMPLHLHGAEPTAWRLSLAESGGSWATKGLGSHLFDLLLWITGRGAEVVGAVFGNHRWTAETEETSTVLLRLEGDAAAVVTMSFGLEGGPSARAPSFVELYGTDGWARADDIFFGAGVLETGDGRRVEYDAERLVPYVEQLADLASAVAGGSSNGADGWAGLAVTELIDAAVAAGRSQQGRAIIDYP